MDTPDWMNIFSHNPIESLLSSGNSAIIYFTKRDILGEPVEEVSILQELSAVQKIIKRQTSEGFWKSTSANRKKHPAQNYDLLETYRHTNILVHMYGLTREHLCMERAAEYLFSCQTDEGDIRGIIGEQYAPYYNGIIVSSLNHAGYAEDSRVERLIQWLLTMRQDDGGWVIGSPGCMGRYTKEELNTLTTQFVGTRQDFDKIQPFAHSGTGMVIRAFSTHPIFRNSLEAKKAAQLLASNFFKKDNYSSYQHPDNWVRFKYPFWWTDLISALDSVSLIGLPRDHEKVAEALEWFIEHQEPSGLWKISYSGIHKNSENSKTRELQLWISLAILRIYKRYYE